MAQQIINNGSFDNDPSAEKIRTAFQKVNEMMAEIYSSISVSGLDGYMTKALYDPDGIQGDAFSMASMKETATRKILTATERANLAAAFSWGNHGDAGYLSSFTETDPVFTAWKDANTFKVESFKASAGQTAHAVAAGVIVNNGLWSVQVGAELWNSRTGITSFTDGLISINFSTGVITFHEPLQGGQHVIIKYI